METGHPHPDSHRNLFGSVDSIANANDMILQSLPAGKTVRCLRYCCANQTAPTPPTGQNMQVETISGARSLKELG